MFAAPPTPLRDLLKPEKKFRTTTPTATAAYHVNRHSWPNCARIVTDKSVGLDELERHTKERGVTKTKNQALIYQRTNKLGEASTERDVSGDTNVM